jgi:DNA invertase Pin-like site-specific DNA recombinase
MNPRIRCAIYTRKSSEEGLEQSFNSLDAQREACEAFVKSQQHEGWQAIATHYDDGGFSGGNLDRPAFKRLMADIHAGKISTVVVYKVDRLTRSLADFAKIIEQFDKFGVSFVSVTQQFNTTTSMGRLTLNVLLSFAQFEREVTGERIRDKIAASKKKGMWMGGTVPLGYDVHDHHLQINEAEATTVRTIFNQFLRSSNVTILREWLRENDIRSKAGNHFFGGPLYQMLHNPLYIGLTRHKTETYPGQHQAILDSETWDKVQALLAANRQGGKRKPRATKSSLFTGLLFDAQGTLYTPTHAAKNGRRYRYYTSQAVIKKKEKIETPTRIPAPDIESAVSERFLKLLRDPDDLVASIRDNAQEEANQPAGFFTRIVARATSTAATWQSLSGPDREHFLRAVIDRVIIHPTRVEIRIRVNQFIQQLLGNNTPMADSRAGNAAGTPQAHVPLIASIECPFRHISQGRALRLIVGNTNITTEASRQAILKAIARARQWYEQITTGKATNIAQLAATDGVSPRFIRMQMKLVQLSPQSIEKLMTRPESLPLSLNDLLAAIPLEWREQSLGLSKKSA